MKNLKSFAEYIKESGEIYLSASDVPVGIRDWAKSMAGKNIQRYKLDQSGKSVTIDMPWHDADRETYQFFKMVGDGNNAIPVGNQLTRSGWESDSQQGYIEGQQKSGSVQIPEGMLLVVYGTYPQRVVIHTGPNAKLMIPDNSKFEDISNEELVVLIAAKSLKSFARPKFPDDVYNKLISKGLLAKNRSITNDGRNLLNDSNIKEKAKKAVDEHNKKTGLGNGYLSVNFY